MKLLFVHQNFPGQYRYLAPSLAADPANEVVAICDKGNDVPGRDLKRIRLLTYDPPSGWSTPTHPYLRSFEAAVRRGQQVARLCLALREQGFVPDVICAHPGWGDALYLKDIYPQSRLLCYLEYFYRSRGAEVGFDPEYPPSLDDLLHVRTRNALNLLSLQSCDWGVCPTRWQWQLQPAEYQKKISVVFDGVDSSRIRPQPDTVLHLGAGKPSLSAADQVITFVSRGLEPLRGWHSFIRAVPEIQRRHPRAQILVVGGDQPAYGAALADTTYKAKYLAEVAGSLDPSRIHFLDRIPFEQYLAVLQVSSAHIYLTYPFILSWSMLEAMACGCLVIGSCTAPVTEVLEDGVNGLLVDFFSAQQIAGAVDGVFAHPDRMQQLRARARQTVVERYDLKSICLPRQLQLIHQLAGGLAPDGTPTRSLE